MSDRYISELQSKISNIKEPIILSDSELRWKLNYIDSLYNDWLINASESTSIKLSSFWILDIFLNQDEIIILKNPY